ncbi:hypothetical protein GCM10007857_83630 [Bradyrhizobium iriomotense]|uniref:Uncharacterized protein n=1 Tax=Bradyrhizobium iriomotense TaxID=441950 RepID=A0ABQ6BFB6_9BRAD|nr:hypothetical protein GCM10007857_83630 [Bradyrhizobium iriomotense]
MCGKTDNINDGWSQAVIASKPRVPELDNESFQPHTVFCGFNCDIAEIQRALLRMCG